MTLPPTKSKVITEWPYDVSESFAENAEPGYIQDVETAWPLVRAVAVGALGWFVLFLAIWKFVF